MKITQLRAFLTIAETGNMTRAAEMLHLVQPAVSRQIRLLEQEIGAALFERKRQGMVLTDAGHALIDHARRAILELERAKTKIRSATSSSMIGSVTLGLLPSTVDTLASSFVKAMSASYPGVQLRITIGYAGTLMQWLRSGEIDASLLYGAKQATDITMIGLVKESLWVIGPIEAGLDRSRPLSLEQVARNSIVLSSAPHGIRTLVEHACAVNQINLKISAETNALSVQRALVLGGLGLTILPPIAVAEDLRANRLSGAPLEKPAITRTIALSFPTSRPIGQPLRNTLEVLTQTIRKSIESGAWPDAHWLG